MISEKGNLQETLFGKLVLNLFEKGVTGILYLRVGGILKEIYFNQGKVIWAMSTADEEKLDLILLEEARIDRTEMDQLKKEHHFSSTVSFFMEEKGMINKTQLNSAFAKQIKRIFIHILTIGEGEYNFVYGLSPKKAIDLELSVPEIMRQAIFENPHTDYIWKFFGSPASEIRKSPIELEIDPPSIPNPDELSLISTLDAWTTISSFLATHQELDEEKAIRTLYLLGACAVIEKRDGSNAEQIQSPSIPAPSTTSFNSIPPEDEAFLKSLQSSLDGPSSMQEFPEDENIELDIEEKPATIDFTSRPPENEEFAPESEDMLRTFPVQIPSSARSRSPLVKFLIWMAALIAIGSGAAYLYMTGKFPSRKNQAVETVDKKPQTVSKETPNQTGTPEPTAGELPVEQGNAPSQGEPAPGTTELPTTSEQSPPKTTSPPPAVHTPPRLPSTSPSPLTLFTQGMFSQAGAAWKRELIDGGFRYGILLELDCMQESVMNAYDQIEDKNKFYILNREKDGRTCYLVLWGRFRNEADGGAVLKQVPQYFWSQSSPPRVVDLTPYF